MVDIESFNDALIACVKSAGGTKQVAPMLWPEKSVNDAQRLLLACLKDDRPEKLNPDQALLIVSYARAVGVHIGIEYVCEKLGYSIPTPIEPKDEIAELQREFIAATKTMAAIAEKLQDKGLLTKGNP